MMKQLTAIALAALSLAACHTSSTSSTDETQLAGSWDIVKVDGNAVTDADQQPELTFDLKESRLGGCTGCNNVMGHIAVKGNSLTISQIGSTRMMCRNMALEANVLKALEKVTSFEKNDEGELLLTDKENVPVLTLKRK